MNEVSFYEEFSEKFSKYLSTYLDKRYKIYYACNNTLDNLIDRLEANSEIKIKPDNVYVPKLKLDIVFAICQEHKPARLILIEAKFLHQLSLKDYSQLVGYLQVAKSINLGLLLLIQKGGSINKLSNDFQEIVRLKKLPMKWFVELEHFSEKHNFNTGIISYVPNSGIEWLDTTEIKGVSSFEELASLLSL
ncbi:hypothetical protein [Pedobacter nyackensis]|uniref:hypothetical protein n=1 Tax=Pedobacter nyackensis TaxID=475255 RepID=UPI00292E9D28|nr:hypothetical protein [Pedobacter nyackensis]